MQFKACGLKFLQHKQQSCRLNVLCSALLIRYVFNQKGFYKFAIFYLCMPGIIIENNYNIVFSFATAIIIFY